MSVLKSPSKGLPKAPFQRPPIAQVTALRRRRNHGRRRTLEGEEDGEWFRERDAVLRPFGGGDSEGYAFDRRAVNI